MPQRRAAWQTAGRGSREYVSTMRAAWRAYERDVAAALRAVAVDGEVTTAAAQRLLSQLRDLAAREYVTAEQLAAAGAAVGDVGVLAALRGLRRAGLPRGLEAELFPHRGELAMGAGGVTDGVAGVSAAVGMGRIGPRGQVVLRLWGDEGARLIQGVTADVATAIAEGTADIVATGARWEELRDLVRQQVGAHESRVKLIARDQTAKLNARITEHMHARAGVTEYTWRATNDQRTRQIHLDADGQIVSWSSDGVPGAGFYGQPAHAGFGGQCRCTAEPVAPAWWGEWAQRERTGRRRAGS